MTDWPKEFTKDVMQGLLAPFPLDEIEFLPKGKISNSGSAMALAYLNRGAVIRRLNEVVGPANWSFNWDPVRIIDAGGKVAGVSVKGSLTIFGVTRCDSGEENGISEEKVKSAVTDAIKRCATHFGIGLYIYYIGDVWAPAKEGYQGRVIFTSPPTIHPKAMENACRIVGYEGKVEVKPQTVKREAPTTAPERPAVTREQVTNAFGEAPPEPSPFDNAPEEHTPAPKPEGGQCSVCARKMTPGQVEFTKRKWGRLLCQLHQVDAKKDGS